MDKKPKSLKILLAAPRGFCAGVHRAIQIVEETIRKYGAPVYVRHEIVHNKYVVDGLRAKGAVFVEDLAEIPEGADRPVIFSAHGVAKSVPEEAQSRRMFYIDATCPLVSKVHKEAQRHYQEGRTIILIGHKGHPEVIGTMGQLPQGAVLLVETISDVRALPILNPDRVAFCTQTTLSVDDTSQIVEEIKKLYPQVEGPIKEDICYATTNRQDAVKAIAPRCDALLVIGAPNSSNSRRLVEVGKAYGCTRAFLVERAQDVAWEEWFGADVHTLGLTAGASAPDCLVEELIEAARARFDITVEPVIMREENVVFNLPRVLREDDPKTQ